MATHLTGHDAVPPPRVAPCQPQRRVGAAFVHGDTPLGHLQALALVVEAVPALLKRRINSDLFGIFKEGKVIIF